MPLRGVGDVCYLVMEAQALIPDVYVSDTYMKKSSCRGDAKLKTLPQSTI